ncbi:MAG: alcohol dehydrogenase catalytic domain-containing protein [Thermoanaerobaculia bacterium]|nr:alcohol dehydrogenase catalytic domain-containing protein [Thermoanaerobaculia bacterium]
MSTSSRVVYLVGPEQLELREVPAPAPGAGELVVRLEGATTCGTDVKVYRRGGHPRMLTVPGPFGHEMAGTVEAKGSETHGWNEGDEVVIANSASCGECAACGSHRENLCTDLHYLNGAYGERILVPERFVRRSLYRKPEGLDPGIAALAEPLACVLHGTELLSLQDTEEIVVLGGGPIGLLFVNVLSHRGHHVVLADPNVSRLEAGKRMGASAVIPVRKTESDTEAIRSQATRDGFGVAIEATGSPLAWESAVGSVRPGGKVLLFGGCAPGTTVPLDTHRLHYSELSLLGGYHHRPKTFAMAIETLADGKIASDVLLTAELPLEEVGSALKLMMEKKALKVRIRV